MSRAGVLMETWRSFKLAAKVVEAVPGAGGGPSPNVSQAWSSVSDSS